MNGYSEIAGSGSLRVTTEEDVSNALIKRAEPEPLEGTRMDLFNSIIPSFFSESGMSGSFFPGNASLADRVWVANRCIQLNAQQIASMPIQFVGTREPAWVSSPDPNVYPNGIGDALHAIVAQMYGWGFSCQYVTDRYEDGYPRTWTVLDSASLNIKFEDGARQYRYGDEILDPSRIIQIDRNPSNAAHGTSALRAYAQVAYGLLAAGNQSMSVNQGGIPQFYLKTLRKMTAEQASDLQTQWMTATSSRNGAPPVIPPEIEPTAMSFDPADLALLETQQWNALALMSAFGVPGMLLNFVLTGGLAYQNPAQLGEMWWRFELRPTGTRIANAFTAQALPRGNWVSFDAADTFLPLDAMSDDDDPQLSQVAKASPAQQPRPLQAIGGSSP